MDSGAATFARELDMRYTGQGYELRVPLDGRRRGRANDAALAEARDRFDGIHARFMATRQRKNRPKVSYRVRARVAVPKYEPNAEANVAETPAPEEARKGSRDVWFTSMPRPKPLSGTVTRCPQGYPVRSRHRRTARQYHRRAGRVDRPRGRLYEPYPDAGGIRMFKVQSETPMPVIPAKADTARRFDCNKEITAFAGMATLLLRYGELADYALDPVTVQILKNKVASLVDEMHYHFHDPGIPPSFAKAGFSCVILDKGGRLIVPPPMFFHAPFLNISSTAQ